MNKKDFFKNFKLSLDSLEEELTLRNCDENYSNIFILGLPRSGTTLLNQIIQSATNCCVPNNLIARFWYAPLVGAHLSKFTLNTNILGDESYQSFFGQTANISQPHEFSLFWQNMMGYTLDQFGLLVRERPPDFERLKDKVLNFNNIFDAPAVWKPLELILNDIEMIESMFGKGIFIFIDRSYKDIALSIYNARIKSKDSSVWWGSAPHSDEFPSIDRKDIMDQIIWQIKYFRKTYENKLKTIDKKRLLVIRFDDMCKQPNHLLHSIRDFSDKLGGKIKVSRKVSPFEIKKRGYVLNNMAELLDPLNDSFGEKQFLFNMTTSEAND